jgi:hypothetical protein
VRRCTPGRVISRNAMQRDKHATVDIDGLRPISARIDVLQSQSLSGRALKNSGIRWAAASAARDLSSGRLIRSRREEPRDILPAAAALIPGRSG